MIKYYKGIKCTEKIWLWFYRHKIELPFWKPTTPFVITTITYKTQKTKQERKNYIDSLLNEGD